MTRHLITLTCPPQHTHTHTRLLCRHAHRSLHLRTCNLVAGCGRLRYRHNRLLFLCTDLSVSSSNQSTFPCFTSCNGQVWIRFEQWHTRFPETRPPAPFGFRVTMIGVWWHHNIYRTFSNAAKHLGPYKSTFRRLLQLFSDYVFKWDATAESKVWIVLLIIWCNHPFWDSCHWVKVSVLSEGKCCMLLNCQQPPSFH